MKIEITVKPNAREDKIEKTGNELKILTTAAPTGGKANKAVIKLLAEYFDVAPSYIKILRGATGRKKLVEIV